jgi:hypothetical protein
MSTFKRGYNPRYYCAVPLCTTKGVSGFHMFPASLCLREKWLKICQISTAKSSTRVCQLHFNKSDYVIAPGTLNDLNKEMRPRLRMGACPALHVPIDLSDSDSRPVLVDPYSINVLNEDLKPRFSKELLRSGSTVTPVTPDTPVTPVTSVPFVLSVPFMPSMPALTTLSTVTPVTPVTPVTLVTPVTNVTPVPSVSSVTIVPSMPALTTLSTVTMTPVTPVPCMTDKMHSGDLHNRSV